MKNIKKQWEQELEDSVPALRKDVMDAPIICGAEMNKNEKQKPLIFPRGQKMAILASCMAAVLTLCLLIPGLLPESGVEPMQYPAAVMLEINPSVVFSVDESGIVTNVMATNADADVILADQTRLAALAGVPISDALKQFVDYAAQLGFLDLSHQSVIRISSCEETQGDDEDQLVNALQEDLEMYFRESGAYIAVAAECMELEEFCDRVGVAQSESLELLIRGMGELSTYYFERHEELWEQSYAEAVETQSRLDAIVEQLFASSEISDGLKKFFAENISSNLAAVFALLDLDMKDLEFMEVPSSYEEYLERIHTYCDEMVAFHKESYETQREEISSDDYEAYIESIIEKYGSLDAYWENKK